MLRRSRSPASDVNPDPGIARRVEGTFSRAALPDRRRFERESIQHRAGRLARTRTGTTAPTSPASCRPLPSAVPLVRSSTATGCSAVAMRSTPAMSGPWRSPTTWSNARRTGSAWPTTTSGMRRRSWATCPSSRRSPIGHNRAFSNTLFLARLLHRADGLASAPAFRNTAGASVIDPSAVFYDGNSQGGIIGGAFMAMSPDVTHGVLGVAGMNYSTLVERSEDFDPFAAILQAELHGSGRAGDWPRPDPDAVGPRRSRRLRRAHDDRPAPRHRAAQGARGHRRRRPPGVDAHGPGRGPHRRALRARAGVRARSQPRRHAGVGHSTRSPSTRSTARPWSCGTAARTFLRSPTPRRATGFDPHEDPRADPDVQQQKSDFLKPNGVVTDVCGPQACTATHS